MKAGSALELSLFEEEEPRKDHLGACEAGGKKGEGKQKGQGS